MKNCAHCAFSALCLPLGSVRFQCEHLWFCVQCERAFFRDPKLWGKAQDPVVLGCAVLRAPPQTYSTCFTCRPHRDEWYEKMRKVRETRAEYTQHDVDVMKEWMRIGAEKFGESMGGQVLVAHNWIKEPR